MTAQAHYGAKVGTRIAMVVSRAMVATHKAMLGVKHKLAMAVFNSISEQISAEVHDTTGAIFRKMAEECPEDSDARHLLNFLAYGHGQWQAVVGTAAGMSGILAVVGQILNNELAPLMYSALGSNPHMLPDPGTLGRIAAVIPQMSGEATGAIRQQGYPSGWDTAIAEINRQYPQAADALEMLRRGIISTAEFTLSLERNGVPAAFIPAFERLATVPLSPADAALAVLRSDITDAEGAKLAALSGIDAATFALLIGNTGEPPGTMQLLEAYRRNFIDRARLERGIRQSRVRNEWIDVIEKIRYSPMSVADAVNSFIQNHISIHEMRTIADENGLEPGQVDTLALTAGEPLSRTESSELVNRGEMTISEMEQALRESRLKDKYIPQALLLRRRLLEPRMLSEAVEFGAASRDYAISVAMKYGYDKQDAEILVNHGVLRKLRTYRDRVMVSVEAMLEDNAITQEGAQSLIHELGYEPDEVKFIMEAARFRQQARLVNTAVTAVRSKLVAHHITVQQASGMLDGIGVPSEQRDHLLKIWEIEVAANTRRLTEAQVVKAIKLKLLTPEEGLVRLRQMGYDEIDAELLIRGA